MLDKELKEWLTEIINDPLFKLVFWFGGAYTLVLINILIRLC